MSRIWECSGPTHTISIRHHLHPISSFYLYLYFSFAVNWSLKKQGLITMSTTLPQHTQQSKSFLGAEIDSGRSQRQLPHNKTYYLLDTHPLFPPILLTAVFFSSPVPLPLGRPSFTCQSVAFSHRVLTHPCRAPVGRITRPGPWDLFYFLSHIRAPSRLWGCAGIYRPVLINRGGVASLEVAREGWMGNRGTSVAEDIGRQAGEIE